MVPSQANYRGMELRNKKNSELQRLKSEYERVKNFNDYTIALRIRQVRLWRLFRKIQDLNAAAASKPKLPRNEPKSYMQLRAESLSRARDLGMEFSRENGMNVNRRMRNPARQSLLFLGEKTLCDSRTSTTRRRLTYGNIHSHENMRRFRSRNSNSRVNAKDHSLRTTSSIEVDRVERLKNRTKYDVANTSSQNLKRQKSNSEDKSQKRKRGSKKNTESLSKTTQDDVIKNYTFVLEEDLPTQSETQLMPGEDTEEHLVHLWNELRSRIPILEAVPFEELMATQSGIEKVLARANQALLDEEAKSSHNIFGEKNPEEYELRKIGNDRNLPVSLLQYNDTAANILPYDDSTDDVRIVQKEKLIKFSKLTFEDDAESQEKTHDSPKAQETSTEFSAERVVTKKTKVLEKQGENSAATTHPNLKKKPLTSLDIKNNNLKEFVKLYEPFPHFHQPVEPAEQPVQQKFESGVLKLRSIFEHQGN